jgi:hypothetical protein
MSSSVGDQEGRRAFGNLIGAVIAVALIALVRGMPDKAERTAAEGGLPE